MIIRALLALALAAVLTGCSSSDADPEPTVHTAADGEAYNDVDVAFATAMVPHLAETLQYVVLADGRALSGEARLLADQIREARVVEVEQLITWLTAWGEPIPETVLDHVNAGHGDDAISGSAEVDELRAASDEEFEELWRATLRDQIADGIPIAEAEQQSGMHHDALALAESLVTTMQEQLAEVE